MQSRAGSAFKHFILLLLGMVCLLASCPARASVTTKKVLVLFPYENNVPGFFYFDNTLRSSLKASAPYQFDFYSESMDLLRFPQDRYFAALVDLYREKYVGRQIDLISATLGPALELLAKYQSELFPGRPVLYVDLDSRLMEDNPLKNRSAVVTGRFDFEGTLELALGFHPDVRNVFVVSGASQVDRSMETLARKTFREFAEPIRFHSVHDADLLSAVFHAIEADRLAKADREQLKGLRDRWKTLTPREREVFRLVVAERLNKQIASELGTADKTVKVHRARVMAKMRACSVAEFVRFADKLGIDPPSL